VELFEQIRREYEHGGGTIRGIAKKLGIHRRIVREAVLRAVPVERKIPVRERPKLARKLSDNPGWRVSHARLKEKTAIARGPATLN
jgi:hypothetical protein